ncbi:SRM1 [Symbiodinium natans]|uniref:SRM1 protein n=1 Tax=Symbiodinium natans TaxID=878477 RepID=A0A812Q9H2_9DINO|nr:SRM1 [Symbiodinium natans]
MPVLGPLLVLAGGLPQAPAADYDAQRGERCGLLTFDQNRLPASEWREQVYEPFMHWSREGGNVHRTTRDMALLLRNALMRGRGAVEGDRGCFCVFLFAVLLRASADLSYALGDPTPPLRSYDLEHTAAHDIMAFFAHLLSRTFRSPLHTSWPIHIAFARALATFRRWGEVKHGVAGSCHCQEPESVLTPVLRLLQEMPVSDWAVADWISFLDFDDPRLTNILAKSCAFEATCDDVQVLAHLLCAEHFLARGEAAKALHKRGRAASVAVFAPFCHPALRAVGSLEDVVYNAALGITEANSKMLTAMLHRALVWRPMPARYGARPLAAPHDFPLPARSGAKRRFALFATLVETEDHYKAQNFPLDAMRLKCSADRLGPEGSELPFHLLYGGGLQDSELTMLMRFGFIIEDYSKEVEYMKQKCCELCPHQERSDGWATTFKLFAWRAVAYDLVLHVDLDACFAGRAPVRSMEDLAAENVTFLSDVSPSGPGWHSHIFALKPSLATFKEIMDFTLGKPRPYCSEQDRLGDVFATAVFARPGGMTAAVPHEPICEDFPVNPYCLERTPERALPSFEVLLKTGRCWASGPNYKDPRGDVVGGWILEFLSSTRDKDGIWLRSDGAAVPFGSNLSDKCNFPPLEEGLSYTQVACGGHHTALLRSDGEAFIVGGLPAKEPSRRRFKENCRKRLPFLPVPELPEGTTYTQVAAGFHHVVLLRSDGKAFAVDEGFLDDNDRCRACVIICDPEEGRRYVQVAAGDIHTLLLLDSGEVVSSGPQHDAACKVPPLPEGVRYKQVAAGDRLSLLLRTDGVAVACGSIQEGGKRVGLDIPDAGPGLAYVQVSVGAQHAALLRSDGRVVAVGLNNYGQCDLPPPLAEDPYLQVLASCDHTILIRAGGSAVSVGRNHCGQCDIPSLDDDCAYADVAASEHNTVLLLSDGRVRAYGGNYHGQCNIPPLYPGERYTQVACGYGHIVLLKSSGTVVACGTNRDGQCDLPAPAEGTSYTQVAALEGCTLLLGSDQSLVHVGAKGDLAPELLEETVSKVRAGKSHVVVIRPDGSAAAYGSNGLGQCNIPPLLEDEVYVDAAVGGYHTLLLTSQGRVLTAGSNAFGQCSIPKLEGTLSYTSVAAGQKVTLLGCSDGSMLSCGRYGDQEYSLPELPPGLSYTRAAAGSFHAALIRSDGCAVHVPTGDLLVGKQWSKAQGVPKKYVPNPAFLPVSERICQLQFRVAGEAIQAQLMSFSGELIAELDVEASCTMHTLSAMADRRLNVACQLVLPGGPSVQQAPTMTVRDAMVALGADAEPGHGYQQKG